MKRVKWCLVLLLVGILLFVSGCTEEPSSEIIKEEEVIFVESIIAHSQPNPGGILYWIEVKLIPLEGARADVWYDVDLLKVGYTVSTESVRWSQNELLTRCTKAVKFYIQKGELPSIGTNLEDIFGTRVRPSPPVLPVTPTGYSDVSIPIEEFQNQPHIDVVMSTVLGGELTVTLGSNPTTGYQWSEEAEISDENIIRQVNHEFVGPGIDKPPGTPGEEVWTFEPLKKGTVTTFLEYSRSWTEDARYRRCTVITVDETSINMDYFLKRTQLAGIDAINMLEVLTNEQLIKIEASRYVAEVSPEDIDQELRRIAVGESGTISESEFKEWYRQRLNEIDLSDSEYKEMVATSLLGARLQEYLKAQALDDWLVEEIKFHEVDWHGLKNGFDSETYAWINWQLTKDVDHWTVTIITTIE